LIICVHNFWKIKLLLCPLRVQSCWVMS
jgi:hypothetical protein